MLCGYTRSSVWEHTGLSNHGLVACFNDKTALAEIAQFERAPREFGSRVQKTLGYLGNSPGELAGAVDSVALLLRETIDLAEGLYQPRYALPQ